MTLTVSRQTNDNKNSVVVGAHCTRGKPAVVVGAYEQGASQLTDRFTGGHSLEVPRCIANVLDELVLVQMLPARRTMSWAARPPRREH